jgi:hypothetical protein
MQLETTAWDIIADTLLFWEFILTNRCIVCGLVRRNRSEVSLKGGGLTKRNRRWRVEGYSQRRSPRNCIYSPERDISRQARRSPYDDQQRPARKRRCRSWECLADNAAHSKDSVRGYKRGSTTDASPKQLIKSTERERRGFSRQARRSPYDDRPQSTGKRKWRSREGFADKRDRADRGRVTED